MVPTANFLAQNSPRFNRNAMERPRLENALLQSRLDAAPAARNALEIENQARQQDIRLRDEQAGFERRKNAAGIAGNILHAIAASPTPKALAAQYFNSSQFQDAISFLGYKPADFTTTDADTDDTIRAGASDARAVIVGPLEQQPPPAGIAEFDAMTAGMSSADVARARRIKLGLDPRADQTGSGEAAPSGYQWTDSKRAALTYVPGGPHDPSGPNTRRNSMQLRKEYEDQQVVKDYRAVLPLYQRASTAPDSRAGDISVIYALGKMFDPTSVVREGELQLSMNAAPWLQKLTAGINSQITGEGRLTPAMRADIMQALQGQVDAMRSPYEQERGLFGDDDPDRLTTTILAG